MAAFCSLPQAGHQSRVVSEPGCGPSSLRAAFFAQQRRPTAGCRGARRERMIVEATAAEEMVADPVKTERAQIQQLLNR
jgi:hypothetical protein